MSMMVVRPELEMTRRGTGSPSEGTHEFVRTATAIGGFDDTCDFIVTDYATHELAIIAMIAYVGSIGGGVAHLKACPLGITQYDIPAPITDSGYDSIILEGEGRNSNLRVIDGAGIMNVIQIQAQDSWAIRDLAIDGNVTNNPEDPGAGDQQCGIRARNVTNCYFENLYIHDCPHQGIRIDNVSYDCTVHACWGADNGRRHVEITDSIRITVSDCHSSGMVASSGYRVEMDSIGCIFIGNTSQDDNRGFTSDADCIACIWIANYVLGCDSAAFQLFGTRHTVTGNTIIDPGEDGFQTNTLTYSIILGNTVESAAFRCVQMVSNSIGNVVAYNIFVGTGNWGIMAAAGCNGNVLHPNRYYGVFNNGRLSDSGTDNIFGARSCQLVQAINGAALADGGLVAPSGVDVDANDEAAVGRRWLPLDVQEVLKIRIYGHSNVIEATNNMLLRIIANAGSSSEQWDAENVDVPNEPSIEEGGIIAKDVLSWIISKADDASLGNFVGGDFVQIMAVGEAAVAPDIGTDALFGEAVIEYI